MREFLDGYYGKAASYLSEYLELVHDEVETTNTRLTCFTSATAPFLNLSLLAKAEKLFNQAEAAVQGDADVLHRVRVARLPLRYAWALRWAVFQDQARREKLTRPGPADQPDAYTPLGVACADIADDQYHAHKLRTLKLHGDVYLWAAPPKNPDNVGSVWVDRFWIVREK